MDLFSSRFHHHGMVVKHEDLTEKIRRLKFSKTRDITIGWKLTYPRQPAIWVLEQSLKSPTDSEAYF